MPLRSAALGGGRLRGAGFPPPKVNLSHTGFGQFTITNFNDQFTYTLSVNAGSVSRSGAVITMSGATDAIVTVTAAFGPSGPAGTGERRAYTFTTTPEQSCSDNCASAYWWPQGNCPGPNCCNSFNNCWGAGVDGNCAADGTICCGGSRGQSCTTTYVPTKNATPSGFLDQFGEWSRAQ